MISGNVGKTEKLAKISALIINNLIVTPATHYYLKPYESDLFMISSSDKTT